MSHALAVPSFDNGAANSAAFDDSTRNDAVSANDHGDALLVHPLASRREFGDTVSGWQRSLKFAAIVAAHALVLYAFSLETVQRQVMNVITAQIISVELPSVKPVEKPPAPEPTQKVKPAPPERTAAPSEKPLQVVATPTPNVVDAPVSEQKSDAVVPVSAPAEKVSDNARNNASAASVASAPASPAPQAPATPRIELPTSNADYLNNPAPPYPAQSKRLREQGKVLLRVFVSAAGLAQNVEIKTSCGFTRLDDIARETVAKWKFVPGTRNGVAEAMWVTVPVVFELS